MGKNRRINGGGSKNSNKCSAFPAAYKLVHLHTNLIFKHSIQNLQNTTKSPLSHHPIQKSQYRTQYRQTLLKSTLSPIISFAPKITLISNSKREINNVTKIYQIRQEYKIDKGDKQNDTTNN